ncbi:uncharacterized protein PGTG_06923 [Puccinia graminis f. sp. tritici CRL 75-36-700-3]|uniref:Uncharacterized protein n=1 Tax=Puccinia graminis f. sp. tritici (strain CRL 75-36-700-3 / race SCCL) TaxID=418459 RepID=E3KAE5_PUCGT|nr:uncharacterized protein PGTG_06923 [Puccinia graminis f. sp. tritici CRL 75-36-700-3]EFP81302.1 hypothetical protein PGTG_06923 [Puccinia graminis f. sp. tritici CRL 75-36-700-3]
MSDGPAIRRALSNPETYHQTSSFSSGKFSPRVSSPLANSYPASASSPLSSSSCIDMFQLVSSPPGPSLLPFSDLPESEPDIRSCDDEMMKMDDESDALPIGSSPRIGHFDTAASSSPGPSWLPALAPNRHDRLFSPSQSTHPRSRAWKQPGSSRASPRSSASETPQSSPTPLSRAYVSKAGQSDRSPSQLRLQAASRLRNIERKNRSNAHRPLLDAFSNGSQRGIDEIISRKDEMMAEELGRRHIKQMNRQWEALLSSQTDEMIEEAEESDLMQEEPIEPDHELDLTQMYAEAAASDAMDSEGPDTSMASACSTVRPDEHHHSLLAILLAPRAICPACPVGTLQATEPAPQGVQCAHCPWGIDGETLASIDQHFLEHGERASHQPVIGYNPDVGTNFVCSNPECDEMVFV